MTFAPSHKTWEIVPQKVLKKFELWVNIYPGFRITYDSKSAADNAENIDIRIGEAEHIVIERWVEE